MDLKTLGDEVKIGEFNAYVSLIRNHIILTESVSINERDILGKYATYSFSFNDATIIDKGILITNETKTAHNLVELVSPIFEHSNYHLTFKLMNITEYNLSLDCAEDYIVTSEFEVVLNKDNNLVELDLGEYDNSMVLLFDVAVKITHDVPKVIEVD